MILRNRHFIIATIVFLNTAHLLNAHSPVSPSNRGSIFKPDSSSRNVRNSSDPLLGFNFTSITAANSREVWEFPFNSTAGVRAYAIYRANVPSRLQLQQIQWIA